MIVIFFDENGRTVTAKTMSWDANLSLKGIGERPVWVYRGLNRDIARARRMGGAKRYPAMIVFGMMGFAKCSTHPAGSGHFAALRQLSRCANRRHSK